jgi:hypothetical protein
VTYLFPVVDGLDVFVFGRLVAWRHVTLAQLFALVDVEGAGKSCLHQAQKLCPELAVLIFVVAVAGDRARVVCDLL